MTLRRLLIGLDTVEAAYYMRPAHGAEFSFEALALEKERLRAVEKGAARAAAEGLQVAFQVADAEDLLFEPWKANFAAVNNDITTEIGRFTEFTDDELLFIRLMDEMFSCGANALLEAAAPFCCQ